MVFLRASFPLLARDASWDMTTSQLDALIENAAERYRSSGRYAWHFARGKLRHDPLFRGLMVEVLLANRGTILDLGCGRGLLFAWLAAATTRPFEPGVRMHGLELCADAVGIARRALEDVAQIDQGDIRSARFPRASVIVIADVLFYLDRQNQDRVLDKAAHALEPGGLLVIREADAAGGWRFSVTKWAERVVGAGRGRLWQPLSYRSRDDWLTTLEGLALEVTLRPLSAGTPFSNVLYVARKRSS